MPGVAVVESAAAGRRVVDIGAVTDTGVAAAAEFGVEQKPAWQNTDWSACIAQI